MATVYGVHREYAEAGKPESDRAIAALVGKNLEALGYTVQMIDGEQAPTLAGNSPDLVFTMARRPETLRAFVGFEERGIPVVNSPKAVQLCFNRARVYEMMADGGLPVPDTRLVSLGEVGDAFPYVLKKPDTHGKKGDTFVVTSAAEKSAAVDSLRASGREQVLLQDFVHGQTQKFYGIGEKVVLPDWKQGQAASQAEDVRNQARRIAGMIGMNVYGGDFIQAPGGETFIIDFNDWPSFSSIREEAGRDIAKLLAARLG